MRSTGCCIPSSALGFYFMFEHAEQTTCILSVHGPACVCRASLLPKFHHGFLHGCDTYGTSVPQTSVGMRNLNIFAWLTNIDNLTETFFGKHQCCHEKNILLQLCQNEWGRNFNYLVSFFGPPKYVKIKLQIRKLKIQFTWK